MKTKFKDFKEQFDKTMIIREHAMADYDKIKRLRDIGDIKSVLTELNIIIDRIKSNFKTYTYYDFKLKSKIYDDIITIIVKYKTAENFDLTTLESIIDEKNVEMKDIICEKIFKRESIPDLFLEIDLQTNRLNKIDIINELPTIFRNLGLGKKIYKALIFEFGFISSNIGDTTPSMDSNLTWHSICQDKEIFSFSHNENLISFSNILTEDIIVEKLIEFFSPILDDPQRDEYVLDADIFIKYPDIFKNTILEKLI